MGLLYEVESINRVILNGVRRLRGNSRRGKGGEIPDRDASRTWSKRDDRI
jgi:hypothetical protein